jgi:hypothetical protein
MLSIQPAGGVGANEKLTSIGIGSSVGHGQNTRTSVFQSEVLVSKLSTVNGLSSCTIVVGEVFLREDRIGGGSGRKQRWRSKNKPTQIVSYKKKTSGDETIRVPSVATYHHLGT